MKTYRLLITMGLSMMAILLMAGIVAAAPATSVAATPVVYDLEGPEPPLTDTLPITHPVGIVIAVYFNIPYTSVLELHDSGFGFGAIARAYMTALASNGALTPEEILALRADGVGWGQIKQDYGIDPGKNGLGMIMRSKPVTPTLTLEPPNNGNGQNCPGNSCNAPGQNKPEKEPKPQKEPKSEPPKGPKTK